MSEVVLDAAVIDGLMSKKDPKEVDIIFKHLEGRLRNKGGNPIFKALGERLEKLRDKAEQGLISSIEFIKQLCDIAKETLKAEKEDSDVNIKSSGKAALTELFLELKTDQTPAIVERIVSDIDEIVRLVRFDGWQNTIPGEREVQKSLRKTLLKYQLHKDEELFNKSYEYIKEYY